MSSQTIAAFVFGDDYLVKETVAKISGMFVEVGDENIDVLDFKMAADEIANPPFFGNKIISMPASAMNQAAFDALDGMKDSVSETCLLIVRGSQLPPSVKKAVKKAGEPTYRMFDLTKAVDAQSATAFVIKRVKDAGGTIEYGAARNLVSISGTTLGMLAQEVDKIMVVSSNITNDHVSALAFPYDSAEYYRFYSYLGNADVENAILEARALVDFYGYEQVDMAISKMLCTALRDATTSYTGCVDIKHHRLNEHVWWPNGKKAGKPMPTAFMAKMAGMISKRHGKDGVESIMRFARDDIARIRLCPNTRHILFIEMKILAVCGMKGSPVIIGSFVD